MHGDRKIAAVADWTDFRAPFFAEAKVASTKASLRSILPRPGGRRGVAATDQGDPSAARVGSDDGKARTERRFEHGPLDVGEVRAVEYDGDPTDVSGRDGARLLGQLFSEVGAAERPCAKYQQ